MAVSQQPPGAWLSGFGRPGSGLQANFLGIGPAANPPVGLNPPVGPRRSSHNPPVGPPHASHNPPVGSPNASDNPPVGPHALRLFSAPGEPPIPWSGLDPDWVWAGSEAALLAQALRRVRDRILPSHDPRLPRSRTTVALGDQPAPTLWRWGESFRVSAAVSELLGRLVVRNKEVWWVPPPEALPPCGRDAPCKLFTLEPPDVQFDYSDQIDKVLRAAVEREERMPEILTQAHDIGVFFDAITGIDRATAPRLRELLDVAWEVSTHLVMQLKHNVAEWRPHQRCARVYPAIVTPSHGSLPSGHATMAMLAAELLGELLYPPADHRRTALQRLAQRIAFNRVVAGVHFPMDSAVGDALARQLASVFVAAGRGYGPPGPFGFEVRFDSELQELMAPRPSPAPAPLHQGAAKATAATPSPIPGLEIWPQLWAAAHREIDQRRI